jgi:hypothetical protein
MNMLSGKDDGGGETKRNDHGVATVTPPRSSERAGTSRIMANRAVYRDRMVNRNRYANDTVTADGPVRLTALGARVIRYVQKSEKKGET